MGIKGESRPLSYRGLLFGTSNRSRGHSLTTGLTALLSEHAPRCMKDHEMKTVRRIPRACHQNANGQLFGRKVAIDASM